MAQERVVYLNGNIVPESEATVSIHDRGFLLGDAVFDTTRTFGHSIFKLHEHLDRLFDSLTYVRIDPGMSKSRMADLTMEVLEANLPLLEEGDDYWVTQRVSRGVRGSSDPTVIVECHPIPFAQRASYYRDGLRVITPSVRRTPPESISPRAKTHNYLNLVLADLEVKERDPDAWAILLDLNGNLAEGEGSNFFIVRDGALATPKPQYVLGGISRETTFELAHEFGIEVKEADIDLFDAYIADEAFITSTSLCICPVSAVNGVAIAGGMVPGPVTSRLQQAYSGLVSMDVVGQYLSRLG